MKQSFTNWLIFTGLSLTWGCSFILMKVGMEALTPFQVASIRLMAAGISLLPFFFQYIRTTPLRKVPVILLSGILGNGIPAFLFCVAESRIDSSLAGILNALTPLMALVAAFLLFKAPVKRQQLLGICIGLAGVVMLFLERGFGNNAYWLYGGWIVLATACYGINISLVQHYLKGYTSLQLGSIALFGVGAMAAAVFFSGDLAAFHAAHFPWASVAAACTLGVVGSGIASVLFYLLIQRAGSLFASMVTYAIPIVAIGWGIAAGEAVTVFQVACLGIILGGVYLVNRKKA